MDIAFVSNVVYPFVKGGAEKRIHEIGTRLVDRGHDVTVYSRHFWDGPAEITHEGIELRAVAPERRLYAEGGRRSIPEALEFGAAVVRPIRRAADRHDIVVASVFPYFPVVGSYLATSLTPTPLVVTWHEVWDQYWTDYLGPLAVAGRLVERVTAKIPQHPVAVSRATARRLAAIGPELENVTVLQNGIDFQKVRGVSPAQRSYDVLYAGRLIKDKHVDQLIDAFVSLVSQSVAELRLGIIGEGPARNDLEALVRERDVERCVDFLGFLDDHEDVLSLMRSATVFASLSTREGFGITFLEAMAAGCVTVGVDAPTSAAEEVIGEAGIVIPEGADPTEYLRMALRSPEDLNPIQRAKQYDWDRVTDRAESYYKSIC